ncbi:TonB family protein [Marinicella sp. W31]|uniref:TonB family protein n=1 Tax=Marinicella sp. W31 TaxID=3023713 RepID=UPI0037571FA3
MIALSSFFQSGCTQKPTLKDSEPQEVLKITPAYPAEPWKNKVEGWVVVEFTINTSGSVESVSVVDSNPVGVFDATALHAIQHHKFGPKIVDGKKVKAIRTKRFEFNIEAYLNNN